MMSKGNAQNEPIDVCITVDTEFDIAGTFNDAARRSPIAEPHVYWEIAGRSHGLGFLLDTLARFNLSATFFVETMNVSYFGDERMGAIARRIRDAGHDVQLHVHPCWTYFDRADWRERLATDPPNDSLVGRSEQEVDTLLRRGIATFERWGLARPVALRTGGMRVNRPVYRLARACGLDAASNVGLAVFAPAEPELQLYSGRHEIDGVMETPVLTYSRVSIGPWLHRNSTLTITGSSWQEMRYLLDDAANLAISPVILLTHPHEFVKSAGGTVRPNYVNQRRFVTLCDFLARHSDRFCVTTFCESQATWRRRGTSPNHRLAVPTAVGLMGVVENTINDRF